MPKYRRGSGSVYLRGNTYWIAYYTSDGKQVCESAKTKDKAEARRILKARQGQIAEGRYLGPSAERVTIEDLADTILTDYQTNGKKTVIDLKIRLFKHLVPFFAGRKAHDITTPDVQAYIAHRQQEEAENGTINRELAALKRAYNLAYQAGRIYKKPYIPTLQEDNARQGFFERHEYERILAFLPEHVRAPITFAYHTGWRFPSEVLSLQWAQVDLAEGTVRLEPGTTKNKDGRLIYLTAEVKALLVGLWQERQASGSPCPWVFFYRGERLLRVKRAWATACKQAGLEGKLAYDFRRTAVRNMVRAGIPERVAMQMSGHKTRSVFDRYHIVSDGDLKEAARRLEQASMPRTTTSLTTIPPTVDSERALSH
jgi:integrase